MPNVHFSFRRGAGDVPEILYGKVEIKPTLAFARGTSLVLPAPTTLDLVNGEATANNVYPTPAPVEGQVEWAYRVKAIDTRGQSFEWMVGVPNSTGTVEFTSLPRYFETKPPLFGKGEKGDPGEAAKITVGSTTSGTTPSVTNSGTNQNAILNFVLPQGPQGPKGDGTFDEYRSANGQPPYRSASDAPNTYPKGLITGLYASAEGWPHNPFSNVITFSGGYGASKTQIATPYAGAPGEPLIRYALSAAAWTPFKPLRGELVTSSANGLMSSADKAKLDGIGTLAYAGKKASDLANTYPEGTTVGAFKTADGWPVIQGGDPDTVTVKTEVPRGYPAATQWAYAYKNDTAELDVSSPVMYRQGFGTLGWGAWQTLATQAWVKENSSQTNVVNVRDYGAVGDGIADDFEAIRAAMSVAGVGDVVYFPSGTYRTDYRNPSDPASWLVLDKNGTTIRGDGDSTILENMLVYVKGTYGTPINISATVNQGDKLVNTSTAHGLNVGDYFQLWSCVNAYTQDGGEWQLGSSNPTNNTQPYARYTEIHQVANKVTANTVETYGEVVYPKYPVTSAGLSKPMPGIANTQVRKLNMLRDVTFENLTIKNTTGTSFRFIQARACANLSFKKVQFVTGSNPGSLVKTSDCYNVTFDSCESRKSLDTLSGSSWNTFIIGGGTQNVVFKNSNFYGEAQCIDFTPNSLTSASDIGGSPDSLGTMSTTQFMEVVDCNFYGCSDGVTSHPGTYMFTVRGSIFEGGSTGIRARSMQSVLQGNVINTARTGISLSAFVNNSLVDGNVITKRNSNKYAGYWNGVSYVSTSSEIMNGNKIRNLRITNNKILGASGNAVDAGIILSHSNPSDYPEFNNEVKVSLSETFIAQNVIASCSLVVEQWVNGTQIFDNTFVEGSSRTHYIMCRPNSAANCIGTNTFFSRPGTAGVSTSNTDLTGYSYSTSNRVAEQLAYNGAIAHDLLNLATVFAGASENTLRSGLAFTNDAKISATRAAGTATINIDAVPQDGSSLAQINMLSKSPTTGVKQVVVSGRILANEYRIGTGAALFAGVGDPNGAVTANIGSLYMRTDGGAGTALYVKQSGTGNTGWTAK